MLPKSKLSVHFISSHLSKKRMSEQNMKKIIAHKHTR